MNGTIQETYSTMCGSPESGIEGICTSIDPHEALNAYVIYIYIRVYIYICSLLYKKRVYIYIVFVCVEQNISLHQTCIYIIFIYTHFQVRHQIIQGFYATSILRSKCGGSTFRSFVIASVAPRLIWSRVIKGLGQRHLNWPGYLDMSTWWKHDGIRKTKSPFCCSMHSFFSWKKFEETHIFIKCWIGAVGGVYVLKVQ